MRKEISIVIATYNAGKTLKKCLNSIISQKGDDIELIIIDGQSKDNTLTIINKYHSYIDQWISEKDKGIYDAWNKGIKLSTGRWIMFVGADDDILSGVLPKYAEFARSVDDSYDLISAKAEFVDLKGKLVKILGEPYKWNRYRYNMNISHGTTLHNRKLFDEIGFYNIGYKICADYELLMRKGKNIKSKFYDCILMRFKIGGASFSYACQKETFKIRKKYHSVLMVINVFLFMKRCLGIFYKKIIFQTNEERY